METKMFEGQVAVVTNLYGMSDEFKDCGVSWPLESLCSIKKKRQA